MGCLRRTCFIARAGVRHLSFKAACQDLDLADITLYACSPSILQPEDGLHFLENSTVNGSRVINNRAVILLKYIANEKISLQLFIQTTIVLARPHFHWLFVTVFFFECTVVVL